MSEEWKTTVAIDVGAAPEPPSPAWHNNVPYCSTECAHHDGKRCGLMGFRVEALCEPIVKAMGDRLAKRMP